MPLFPLLRLPLFRRFSSPILLLAALLIFPAMAHAQADSLPPPVARALQTAGVPAFAVAIFVQEVDARAPRLSVNAAAPMNPASVMKLLTTYAGLELLGPAYTWRTEVYAAGPIRDGVLTGDLVLKGYGDPKLGLEQFWLLLRQLRAKGLREIRGDLVLDRAYFAAQPHDPARFDNEPLRPYNVGPDALLLNYKSIRLDFALDAADGSVTVSAEPALAQLELVNLVKPGKGACGSAWYDDIGMEFIPAGASARLILSGSYSVACGEKSRHVAVFDHPQFIAGVFRPLWSELGGRFEGVVREGGAPAGARLLARAESPALAEVVREINKFSNNVMARQLYLTLGAETGKPPARNAEANAALRAWLERKGLRIPELSIENGAGLSRSDRISADSLARLLAAAWASPVMPEFIASLPLAGVDGTMRKRLAGDAIAGQTHVKTGYLEGVRALAGYVLDKNGKRVIVVFLANHPNATAAKAAQDALLSCVYDASC
ncbi:MAG: D-alanyl-D-alanine carboxypeptidase/D-alanyl-D-alanine-endopeptidase [Zoogloeaceae bacterium]|jgi:D-alanyl-D-alanine carboxypeptidase/D-alanyl-D-alanine-endopeptidase (penicillin-binding protein 4)|nr:D-alanyl-D-alanine carboxypeptidase/D-alanyl-D-alanine-endopeptidase [Zoogloeaceae bacterium]